MGTPCEKITLDTPAPFNQNTYLGCTQTGVEISDAAVKIKSKLFHSIDEDKNRREDLKVRDDKELAELSGIPLDTDPTLGSEKSSQAKAKAKW